MAKRVFKRRYYKLWWGAIHQFNLSPTEALLLGLIDGLSRRIGWCYASKKSLAKTLNVSMQTIYNTMKKLSEKGLLVQSYKKLENYNTTLLTPTQKWIDFIEALEFGLDYIENEETD